MLRMSKYLLGDKVRLTPLLGLNKESVLIVEDVIPVELSQIDSDLYKLKGFDLWVPEAALSAVE